MSLRSLLLASLLLPSSLLAQTPALPSSPPALPASRFAVDLGVLHGTLSFASRFREEWSWGLGAGVGSDLLYWMVLAGEHFAEDNSIAYAPRDESGGERLFELVHANLFVRRDPPGRWQLETGVRSSLFFHFDDSDDEPGGGVFLGAYGGAFWGGRRVKVGPRVVAGLFAEQSSRELGVYLSPLTVRILFP